MLKGTRAGRFVAKRRFVMLLIAICICGAGFHTPKGKQQKAGEVGAAIEVKGIGFVWEGKGATGKAG